MWPKCHHHEILYLWLATSYISYDLEYYIPSVEIIIEERAGRMVKWILNNGSKSLLPVKLWIRPALI